MRTDEYERFRRWQNARPEPRPVRSGIPLWAWLLIAAIAILSKH